MKVLIRNTIYLSIYIFDMSLKVYVYVGGVCHYYSLQLRHSHVRWNTRLFVAAEVLTTFSHRVGGASQGQAALEAGGVADGTTGHHIARRSLGQDPFSIYIGHHELAHSAGHLQSLLARPQRPTDATARGKQQLSCRAAPRYSPSQSALLFFITELTQQKKSLPPPLPRPDQHLPRQNHGALHLHVHLVTGEVGTAQETGLAITQAQTGPVALAGRTGGGAGGAARPVHQIVRHPLEA